MENKFSLGFVWRLWIPATLLAVGLLLLGLCVKGGLDGITNNARTVTVRGLSEREVMANKVTWPIVCKEVGNGVADSEISVNAPQVVDMQADRYDSQPAPFRYNVTSVIVVTSSKVEMVRRLIQRQTELLRQGIAIVAGDYNYQTTYEYTDLNSVKPAMIADATKNARKAADKFAEDSESHLGKIKTASQGQFSIEDRDQYTPYMKRIRVVSTIVYYLKD